MYRVEMLDEGMNHIPGQMELDCVRFHQATPNSMQFKTCKIVYFWEFSFNFQTMVDGGLKLKPQKAKTIVFCKLAQAGTLTSKFDLSFVPFIL